MVGGLLQPSTRQVSKLIHYDIIAANDCGIGNVNTVQIKPISYWTGEWCEYTCLNPAYNGAMGAGSVC